MEEYRISDDVYEQIKDFSWLTEEQKLLVDKLILNKEIKERYIKFRLCKGCKQPKSAADWCQPCYYKRFQEDFENWTSGNPAIDKFIQNIQLKANIKEEVIEWVEYNDLENVEYLAKGGFGIVYKAIWRQGKIHTWNFDSNRWKRDRSQRVVLKYIYNSQDNIAEFLREVESHVIANELGSVGVIRCYGITKNPETNEYMMIMQQGMNGSLRQSLDENFNSLNWILKLDMLKWMSWGLCSIHRRGLIHRDFHSGNIINIANAMVSVTDLGLCRPLDAQNNDAYGVLPYVAPEVLRGKEYTQKSDIYGFGIIAYEICTGLPPYHDIAHDRTLAIKICQGLRPKSNYNIPRLILDIIHRCWDDDSLKRPTADEMAELFYDYRREIVYNENTEICKQVEEVEEINKNLPSLTAHLSNTNTLSYTTHPQAIYTSRILDFKDLPESNLINLRIDPEDENN